METQEESEVPGTVHLVDVNHSLRVTHATGSERDIVLVPAPSGDPDDPLNWSPRRKALSTICVSTYTLMVGIASAAVYSVLEPISEATGLSLNELNSGTGYMFLFFGWGCLIWQPLALQYGKRPVYLFSMLATLAIMVWTPYTNTSGQYLASKILQGFFGAPIESLCEISVADIYFQHERGRYIGLYALMLAGSNFLAPVLAGFITDGQGWQWVLYWCAIFLAIGFVFNLFFMEETNYDRRYAISARDTFSSSNSAKSETIVNGPAEEVEKPIDSAPTPDRIVEDTSERPAGPTKSYLQKLSLKPQRRPFRLPALLPRPLILLSFPVVFYAGFSYGSNLIWFNVLNGTASDFLASPPYNFAASIVGLSYVSPLIGVAIGSLYSGRFGDWFVLRMARHRNGILEPEYRLWLFLVSCFLIPGSLILWGVGAAYGIHWFGLIFAMGLIAICNTVGLQLSVSYAIDSYRGLAGEVVVSVILVRNTMSFAIGYGLTPWVQGMGRQNAFILAGLVGLAQCLTFLAMVRWGKGLRNRSRERYWKLLEQGRRLGVAG